MNKYQIQIKGMHCSGCQNLLQMILEEKDFSNVLVDREKNIGVFETNRPEVEVVQLLNETFEEAGTDYSYTDIQRI